MWLKIYTSNYLNLWCNILDRTVSRFYGTRSCNAVFTKSHTWTLLWIGLVLFILLNLTSLMTDLILLSHIGLFHLSFASFLAGLSLRNTGFDRRSVHVRFVVDEVLPRLFFFPAGTSVFPCQYHSTNDLHSYTWCYPQNDKWAKPGNLPKSNQRALRRKKKNFHFSFKGTKRLFQQYNHHALLLGQYVLAASVFKFWRRR